MELVKCINVNKSFGNKKILRDVNLTIPKGKIIGLLGKNGTGKSTLIKLINDLLTPTTGEILVNGKKVGLESKKIISYLEKNSVSYCQFQLFLEHSYCSLRILELPWMPISCL